MNKIVLYSWNLILLNYKKIVLKTTGTTTDVGDCPKPHAAWIDPDTEEYLLHDFTHKGV